MKMLVSLLFISFLSSGNVLADSFKSPDILLDTKLDYDWSSLVVTKLRVAMRNYGISDPFQGRFEGPMLINESEVGNLLPAASLPLVRNMGELVGLKLLKTKTKVEVFNLSYDLKGFKTDLKTTEQTADGLVLSTDFSASQLFLTVDKLRFSLIIPGKGEANVLLEIDVIKPFIKARQERLINIFSRIKIQDLGDAYRLKVLEANFERMAQNLLDHPEDLELDYERIIIPEVSLRVGNRSLDFSPQKIEKLLRSKHEAIKGILLAKAASLLRKGTAESVFKVLDKYKINKEHWLNAERIQAHVNISQFTSTLSRNNIEVKIPADFCTTQKFDKLKKECIEQKVTKTSDTRITPALHQKSLNVMKDLMESGDANIIASISEDYFNKLLVTTYDAGMWTETLKEAGVALGPNKVVLRMDKKGDSGTLILDVMYKLTGGQAFLIGTKTVRFPLILDVSIRVEKHENEPVIIVRLNDVDLTEKTLKYGRPEIGVVSGIKDVRFKGKVIKTISNKLIKLKNKDIIELRFPTMRGIGLDKIDFLSDGNGRMHAMMKLEDLIEPEGMADVERHLIEELK